MQYLTIYAMFVHPVALAGPVYDFWWGEVEYSSTNAGTFFTTVSVAVCVTVSNKYVTWIWNSTPFQLVILKKVIV
jgi:hypothetical protein